MKKTIMLLLGLFIFWYVLSTELEKDKEEYLRNPIEYCNENYFYSSHIPYSCAKFIK